MYGFRTYVGFSRAFKKEFLVTPAIFARCIFFGWSKEYEDRIDYKRCSFERYVNNKVYFYVPVKY